MFVVFDHMSPKWVDDGVAESLYAAVDIVIHPGLRKRRRFTTGSFSAVSFLFNFVTWKTLVSVN